MNHVLKSLCYSLSTWIILQALIFPVNAAEVIPAETSAEVPVATESIDSVQPVSDTTRDDRIIVPQFFQTDYPETPYSAGTIATHGSSITALAMVATYVTGQEHLPDTLAEQYNACGENNMDRLEYASSALGLSWQKAENVHTVFSALLDGKIAIVLLNENSIFSKNYHFIVLTGINAAGRITVNDPYAPNYEHWQLQNAFQNGFAEGDIVCGYSGGWIYDMAESPSDIQGDPSAEESIAAEEVMSSETEITEDTQITEGTEPLEETQPIEETEVTEPIVISIETPAETQVIAEETVVTEAETTASSYPQVPLYFQTDYPNDRFAYGTVASSGCSVTSLAMVATYMTGHEYLPNELADWFGGYGQNNVERLEYGSTRLQLPWRRAKNIHDVMDELRAGNLAIVLMGSNSLFTKSQHFIVLTGLTTDGKIMVNDSYAPNYDDWQLRYLFRTGFLEEHIIKGYSGAWIYDVSAMTENPFIYTEEKPYVECRYPGLELTWEEQQLLAKVIWVEARGESKEGQQAVAEIVFNRLISGNYGQTIHNVIYGEGQFRSVPFLEDAEPSQAQYEALEDALAGPYILPIDVLYFATTPTNSNVWGRIGGHIFCYES